MNTPIPTHLIQYLQYVHNTGGVTVAQFDDDWEPVGFMVRAELMPTYLVEDMTDKKLMLTPEGETARVSHGHK
jgi:hypothetical protein